MWRRQGDRRRGRISKQVGISSLATATCSYLLRVVRKMILPWLLGSLIPGQMVVAYWVAVSWAIHLTAYCMPWRHGLRWEGPPCTGWKWGDPNFWNPDSTC